MLKLLNITVFILTVCILIVSCKLDEIEIEDWSPEIISPLINTTLTIADLIPEKGSTQYDDDGLIRLAVRDDNVYTLTSESFINIPDEISFQEQFILSDLEIDDFVQDTVFTVEEIVIGAADDPLVQNLLSLAGIQVPFPPTQDIQGTYFTFINETLIPDVNFQLDDFYSASFITGQLEIQLTNKLDIGIENIDLELGTGLGSIGSVQISNLLPNQSYFEVIDLSGLTIDNNIFVNFIDLALENVGLSMVELTPESGFEISFSITNINVSAIEMLFNNQQLDAGMNYFQLEIEEEEEHKIHTIQVGSGEISYSLNSSLDDCEIIVQFGIPFSSINGNEFLSDPIQLNGNTVEGTIDISGLEVDLTQNPILSYNYIPVSSEVILNSPNLVVLTNSDFLDAQFSFSNLEIDYLDGYFASQTLDLGGDTIDVDLALFEDFDSGLILEDPSFTINIRNSLGVKADIDGSLVVFSETGNQASLDIVETINRAIFVGDEVEMSWSFDPDDIDELIALPPHIISYNAEATVIDETGSFPKSFVSADGKMSIGVDIDFPLSISAANISLRDTIILNDFSYDLSQLERLVLHFNLVNGFPLGTEFNLILHDSISGNDLDIIPFIGHNSQNDIINPAELDSEGNIIAVLSSGLIYMSDEEINNFLNSNKLIIDVTLNTTNSDEEEYVKLYSDYECLLKVGIETQINLD